MDSHRVFTMLVFCVEDVSPRSRSRYCARWLCKVAAESHEGGTRRHCFQLADADCRSRSSTTTATVFETLNYLVTDSP